MRVIASHSISGHCMSCHVIACQCHVHVISLHSRIRSFIFFACTHSFHSTHCISCLHASMKYTSLHVMSCSVISFMHTCAFHVFQAFTHSPIHAFMQSCIHSFSHTCIHSFISCVHSFIISAMHSCIPVHSCMRACVHQCMHSVFMLWHAAPCSAAPCPAM